ncbi:outer membrane lipoprotein chaperone LolA [Moritella viscosa]|uniref:Outer-membrane lipoprotein carrier protein n=1 Tax=Moritella viscosa TaxID=80854 RepID=A0ABY1HAK5_9GAMM|nr:outer membrane lipoprotein chaperone LolA [Moritella viscosa]SGY88299.1 Outer-membrane lipoprotein carrier protein [Moritella viscosa]SGY95325.1 Outer-membrane lipoprotein carrier protein [Moritella viscosa]SHO25586.1 Outer-membrane lipoprotein carrier protein [Moritella viscosa]
MKQKISLKKIVATAVLMTASMVTHAQSVKEELQGQLAQLKPFSADFTQTVTSAEGDNLSIAQGSMQLQRPNQFRWETVSPDEQLIVSNGESLWFYNPFVEQVSIYSLKDAIANTPFMLIAGSEQAAWRNYRVTKKAGVYTVITPNDPAAAVFTLQFKQGEMSQFSVQEQQGQHSQFVLTNRKTMNKMDPALFNFIIPEDTDIDDQR